MKSLNSTSNAKDLLEIIHRRHGKASTLVATATNRPVAECGVFLGDAAIAGTGAIIDRILESAMVKPQRAQVPEDQKTQDPQTARNVSPIVPTTVSL